MSTPLRTSCACSVCSSQCALHSCISAPMPNESEHAEVTVTFLLQKVEYFVSHSCETQIHLEGDVPQHQSQHCIQLLAIIDGVGQVPKAPCIIIIGVSNDENSAVCSRHGPLAADIVCCHVRA
eukprot:763626-Rhodomonas_salina.1